MWKIHEKEHKIFMLNKLILIKYVKKTFIILKHLKIGFWVH